MEGGDSIVRGPTPFYFEIMLLKGKGFNSCVIEWWNNFKFRGVSNFALAEKMKALKLKLKVWNKEVFRKVEEKKKQI